MFSDAVALYPAVSSSRTGTEADERGCRVSRPLRFYFRQ